ncbi:integrase, catalytic region, zinc finger, CCHC-type containing protein [Tanacetum coccineum]|uniref:Integrase, catalytic region, zinc finger, CCHC-type containing protein n=1 Tax=Tanacetum coccineum TaxID=301880 RepID=A0ABQ5J5S0_9ASTR
MSQDVMMCVMNSTAVFDDVNVEMRNSESCVKCLDLDAELLNKQNAYNDLLKSYSQLEKHCISLELTMQLNQEIFQEDSLSNNQNALEILEYFEHNDLKAQLQAKDTTIYLEPLAPRLLNKREAHIYYLKHTQEQADILRRIVKQPKAKQPLDNALDFACKHAKQIQELLVYVQDTCPNVYKPRLKCSTSTCRSQPTGNKKNDRISQMPSSNLVNKVEVKRYPDCSLVSGLRMLKTYDRESFSAHELCTRDTNFDKISFDDMLKTSSICLISKASKTKSWLWNRRLSHLNFGTLNKLAKDGLARGILKLKFQKDHLYNGTEFVSQTLRDFYENVGISHQTSVTRTPQQNGVVESKDLGQLNAKVDIGIFVGYAPAKKSFRIYNRITWKIMETIHVTFDELATMASE